MSDLLRVEGVSKEYDNAPLLRGISFGVAAGEIVCLLGPSGTGKTTLLRIIAGLEDADAGRVVFQGKDLGVPPHERGFGMMFQDLALFPHKNVYDNVAFGLRMRRSSGRASEQEIRARVEESLAMVGLDAARFALRDVNRLSGGEQQRVALARTIAPQPRLIMFDEPLGALDRILREDLVGELRALLKRLHMTALYVTHDQDEAFAIADRLVLLNGGHIEQMGTPHELYSQPANAFVARFMGLTNLVEISRLQTTDDRTQTAEQNAVARTDVGSFTIERARVPETGRRETENRTPPADLKADKRMGEFLEKGLEGQNAAARTDVGSFIIERARDPETGRRETENRTPADLKADKRMGEFLEKGTEGQNAVARTDVGSFIIERARDPERGAKFVLLRPRAIGRIVDESDWKENVLRGTVTETQWRGGQQRIVVEVKGHEFVFEVDAPVPSGKAVALELIESEIDFLPAA